MSIFVNRTLNLKSISCIGFDMDYTIVRYNTANFERLTHQEVIKKLILQKHYPSIIKKLKFDEKRVIRGLAIDKKLGNLIKIGHYGKVRKSFHGQKEIDYKNQKKIYQELTVDLNDPRYTCIDTSFSLAHALLYSQLVELKDRYPALPFPSYEILESDVGELVDEAHRDGTLKDKVRENIEHYIVQDPGCVEALERFRQSGKKLLLITNSDFFYTKMLLDHTITPFLKKYKNWSELFNIVITLAAKPRFFTDNMPMFKIGAETGLMANVKGPLTDGIYQGGCARFLQKELKLHGEEILYLGDHIYGDILTLKKNCNWRTALVIEEIEDEVKALHKGQKIQQKIETLMDKKIVLEKKVENFQEKYRLGQLSKTSLKTLRGEQAKIIKIDREVSKLLETYQKYFNPYWGEMMRAGIESSRFAGQVEKYACIYMSKISDFLQHSPKTYFRPKRRTLPHEL